MPRHKKRSGIPIAPSGTECVARRDDAKRSPPSPTGRRDCGCDERFPRKDPGVFDLLGSSLSCDTTVLTPLLSISAYGLPHRCVVSAQKKTALKCRPSEGNASNQEVLRGRRASPIHTLPEGCRLRTAKKKDRPLRRPPARRIRRKYSAVCPVSK